MAIAVAVSSLRFADAGSEGRQVAHVVLARDDDFADALTGAALTAGGPLLFTAADALHAASEAELQHVLTSGGTVTLLGGEAAISDAVAQRVADLGYAVARLEGATPSRLRWRSPRRWARRRARPCCWHGPPGPADRPTAAWADSLGGGALAAAAGVPLLLTTTEELHPAVAAYLEDTSPSQVVLLGGEAALSAEVAASVPGAVRVAGAERTATAARIAAELWGLPEGTPARFVVVPAEHPSGWAFGLAAAGLSADAAAPLLLLGNLVTDRPCGAVASCGEPRTDLAIVGAGNIVSGGVREWLDLADGHACGGDPELERRPRAAAHGVVVRAPPRVVQGRGQRAPAALHPSHARGRADGGREPRRAGCAGARRGNGRGRPRLGGGPRDTASGLAERPGQFAGGSGAAARGAGPPPARPRRPPRGAERGGVP